MKAKHFAYISALDVSGNQTLTEECCQYIASFIELQRRFHSLNISGCTELGSGINLIFKSLRHKSAEKLAENEEKETRDAKRTDQRYNALFELGEAV